MSFNMFASIAASDAASNASAWSSSSIGVKILVGAAVVVIMLVGGWLAILRRMRRQKWAESQGFRYIKEDVDLGKATRRVFRLAGRRHVARDVVVIPSAAGTALYYEVTWVEQHGENKERKKRTFMRYSLPGPLPRMRIKPEGMLGFANDDINTEWQAFNKAFEVESEDEQAAHALLTGPMQEFLMDHMRKMHMEIVGGGAFLRLSRYKSEDSVVYARLMDEWFARVPEFLFGRG